MGSALNRLNAIDTTEADRQYASFIQSNRERNSVDLSATVDKLESEREANNWVKQLSSWATTPQGKVSDRINTDATNLLEKRKRKSETQAKVKELDDRLNELSASGDINGAYTLEKERDRLKSQLKYGNANYQVDDLSDQTQAGYGLTRLSSDASFAANDYLNAPTDENWKKFMYAKEALEEYQKRNQKVLDARSENPEIVQAFQSWWGNLPQQMDQAGAGIQAGLVGAGVGSIIPGVGTMAGLKAGYVAGSAKVSYDMVRGSVFMDLVAMGVDKEVAKRAATDEAVISAALESLDTLMDVSGLGLGFGSILNAAGKGAMKLFAKEGMELAAESAGKKLLKSLGKYGLNIMQESLEEGSQQAVSIANRDRFTGGNFMFDPKTQGTPAMQDGRLSSIGELAGKAIGVGKETFDVVTGKESAEPTNIYEEMALSGVSPEIADVYLMTKMGYTDSQAKAAARVYDRRFDELQTRARKANNAREIGDAAKEGARIAAVSGIVQPAFNTAVQTGITVAGGRLADINRTMPQFKDAAPSPLPDAKQVAKNNVTVETSETAARMNETAQKAVADAQVADYGETVKADNTTVLDKASTLYASRLGVTSKVANTKAAVLQKVMNGENITLGELGKLDLTNPKSRAVFTELTGFQFPENTKALENRQFQLSLMKQVPGVMTERAELSNTVQQVQQMSREADGQVQAAKVDMAAEEAKVAAQVREETPVVGESGMPNVEYFADWYRAKVNEKASPDEVAEAYHDFRSDSFEEDGKTYTRGEFIEQMRANGSPMSDEALNQYFDYYSKSKNRDAVVTNDAKTTAQPAVENDLRGELQENTRKVIEDVERKLGIKVIVERKVAGPAGKTIRGKLVGGRREIHIAIGANGDVNHGDVVLQVLRHELTHYLQSTSPKSYESFKKFVVGNMSDYEARYNKKTKDYKGVIGDKDKSRIEDELVAEYSEKLFTDEEFIGMIARTDRSLAEKIRDAIRNFIERLTGDEELSELRKTAEKAQRMWEKALRETAVKVSKDGIVTNHNGNPVAQHNDGVTQFSMRTYEEQGREYLNTWLVKAVDRGDLTLEEADDIRNQMDGIYEICQQYRGEYGPFGAWSDAAVVVDEDGKPVFSVVKSNGDYALNLDFSLVCKKRRTLDAVLNEMVKSGVINEFNIGEKEIVQINDIIRDHGFEVACAMCFVDAKRFKQGQVADTFTSLYNGLVKSLVPKGSGLKIGHFNFGGNESLPVVDGGIDTLADDMLDFSKLDKVMATKGEKTVPYKIAQHLKNNPGDRKLMDRGDLMSTAGFDALKTRNPELLKLYNAKKGTGGPKAAFGDVQYLSEILSSRSFNVDSAYPVGGVRVQSFSDYMPRMVFDYVQMIGDLAAKKLPAHAYTKEELFVKQFGLTGMKINMSLIPRVDKDGIAPGLDADGNYVWADESFDYDAAVEIQNADGYRDNCGTICVGVSNEHIRALMEDENIRMVIPYHKSSLNPTVARMNHISEFVDYTGCQSTRRPTGGVDKKTGAQSGKKLDKKVAADKKLMDSEPQFNVILREVGDPYKASEVYVRWCEDNNLLPKFDQFAYRQIDGEYVVNDEGKRIVDENYYKLLEDFTVSVDGEYMPQTGVRAVFPGENDAFGPMKDLIARGLKDDAIAEGKRDSEVPKIVKEIRAALGGEDAGVQYSFEDDSLPNIHLPAEVIFGARYSKLKNNGDIADYNRAKGGDVEAAFRLIQKYVTEEHVTKIANFGKHVYLLPVQNEAGKSSNVIPLTLGSYLSAATGQPLLDSVYQSDYLNRRNQSNESRLTAPDVGFDVDDEMVYNILKGAEVIGIDDNTSYGSTLRGLAKFLQEHGAKMVGSYVLTVGGDNSEAMVVTDQTWDAIKKEGVEKVERFAREQGYTDAFTREHLGERRAQDFLSLYQKNTGRRKSSGRAEPSAPGADQTVHGGQQSSPEALPRSKSDITPSDKASDISGAFSMPESRYAVESDPLREEFVKSFDAQFGAGAAEVMFRTHEQMKRAAQRAGVKAKTTEESAAAERALAKQRLENQMTAWEIHHRKTIRDIQRKYANKIDHERKAKAEAVADTKLVERAKAEIRVQATEMNLGKKAAERDRTLQERVAKQKADAADRLRITKDAYQSKLTESNKLRRNAAKRLLSDASAVAKRKAEIETAQGPVDTIRKNPRERVKMEEMKSTADSLRTLGRTTYRNFVNMAQEIDSFAKRQRGGVYASTLVNVLGGSGSTADRIFKNGLVDRSGNKIADSMKDVLLCVDATGKKVDEAKQALLQDYMLHLHNVDRMSFVANARAALEKFETKHTWLSNLETKELAKLVALTDAEVADAKVDGRTGKVKHGQNGWTEADRKLAWEYAQLLENYRNAEDKPVFADENGNPVTAETSREIVAKYDADHGWLRDKANGVFEWWDLFMRNWAVGDSLSLAEYESMRQTYPHYVPTYRVGKGGPGGTGSVNGTSASVSKATKAAKGSTLEIVNIEDSFANIASKIVRLARTNELYMNIIDTAMLDEEGLFSDMAVFDWDWQSEEYGDTLQLQALLNGETASEIEESTKVGLQKDGPNFRLSGWKDGRVYSAVISKDLFTSIAEVTGYADEKFKRVTKIGNTLTGPMKTAITGVNPFFAVRNLSRDIPTAIINSTGVKFPKYWARAINEIRTNSDNWQVFQSLGGVHSGYYNNENGFAASLAQGEGLVSTGLDKLGALNNVTEAATRFAEYLSTIDRMGDTYEARMQGIKNSAEVTVDFSRKGSYGQFINAWVPYWNPAVQGIDKLIRSVADAPDGSTILKQAMKTGGRALMNTVLLEGILWAVLHALDRDEEWDELSDRDKAQYYCIPLPGEHKFLKIAKNREWGAILGTPFMLTLEGLDGRQNPFENYVETSLEPNFLPPAVLRPREDGGFSSDIIGISTALDLAYNQDFAGRTIIPYSLQQGSLTQQYDSETSVLSRTLGKLFNFSPMQIDYIVKDYFGDFGEVFLNLTAPATWASDKTPADFVASTWDTFAGSFVTDNRYSNQTVSTYYETLDALDKVVNDKKNQMGAEEYKSTKEYKIQKGLDELYGKQITDLNKQVRGLPDGPDKDALKEEIAQLAGAAMDFYKQSMSGEIAEPLLTATYANLPASVSNELIRLGSFAEDYAFAPTDYKPSAYTDPRNSRREYVLDDEAKDMYRTIYDQQYAEVMSEILNKTRYRKANDQKKAEMLEDARDTVTERTKDEFLDWLAKNRRSTEKSK